MGQFTLSLLFIITLMVGVYVYFIPAHRPETPLLNEMNSEGVYYNKEESSIIDESSSKRNQDISITTNGGIVQIHRKIDDLTLEQKKLENMIETEEQVMAYNNKEIADLNKQANDKNDVDVLRFKALSQQMQDDQRLLVAHGQQLLALKEQINKNRQLLAEQSDLININNDSYLQTQKQQNAVHNDQAAGLFEKETEQSDEEHQKMQDQQQITQQRMDDEQQRMQDLRDR